MRRNSILSKEERIKILKTMEEDIEFRYAIAGMLKVLDIFKRLDAIERRIEEHSRILEEHSKRLEELSKRVKEHSKILQEHNKRLEDITSFLEVRYLLLEEFSTVVMSVSKRLLGRVINIFVKLK
ncbi:MAG: hypothetical protein QXZ41_02405 [Ignisphaera sp.]